MELTNAELKLLCTALSKLPLTDEVQALHSRCASTLVERWTAELEAK